MTEPPSIAGYELLDARYSWFRRGPFFFRSSEEQAVFYVTVRDPEGQQRRGWVRCGGFWLGLFSDQATVKWDE